MFSIQYPSIITHLGQMPYGLQPVFLTTKSTFSLLLKATKEAILTARLNKQVKIYLIPDNTAEGFSLGLITAFFDDHDEPIVLFTPLYAADSMLVELIAVLCQDTFDLYFFDEHDREMMGVDAHVQGAERFRQTVSSAKFQRFDLNGVGETLKSMGDGSVSAVPQMMNALLSSNLKAHYIPTI